MRKVITENGHKVLEVQEKEHHIFGKHTNDCDVCNSIDMSKGYYLPIVQKVCCMHCFENWNHSVSFFPEDSIYEKTEFERLKI